MSPGLYSTLLRLPLCMHHFSMVSFLAKFSVSVSPWYQGIFAPDIFLLYTLVIKLVSGTKHYICTGMAVMRVNEGQHTYWYGMVSLSLHCNATGA